MKRIITERLARIRDIMERESLDAVFVSGTDPHMSEYLCEHWQVRRFMTGFTGSFGEVVITRDHAGLWTDTRYFLQAEEQLSDTGFLLHKLRVPDAVPAVTWLCRHLPPGARVGTDPLSLPLATYRNFLREMEQVQVAVVLCPDIPYAIWTDRPALPQKPLFSLDDQITGESRLSKLNRVTGAVSEAGADLTIIVALDDLAWTFNLRGNDVEYNPVFLGFGIAGHEVRALFVAEPAVSPEIRETMESEGIEIFDYTEFYPFLEGISGKTFHIDPSGVNTAVWNAIRTNNKTIEGTSIPAVLKAVKNKKELEGFREAMQKDGAAMVRFLHWLKKNLGKTKITEYTAAQKLKELRSLQPGFRGESFAPIVGYRDHGAIVHLSVGEENAHELLPEGILLFDSGGQYDTGTTDITRTIALGPVSEQQKKDYTLVLKGMMNLSMAVFPSGTKGIQLDVLARHALWSEGLNYGHGTGHGVGHFLNVHEGPSSIRQDFNVHYIRPGMVFSNEPGLYRTGEYGIRTENMLVCVEKKENEFGTFYGFDTLTLCPVDTSLIMPDMLSASETEWLNTYHIEVREKLTPLLSGELITFLEQLTKPL